MAGKILYCASTVSHLRNFHLPYLRAFHEMGYEVWAAAEKEESVPYVDHFVALPFQKKITSPENIRAVFAVRKLMKEQKFDLVSMHTMLASAVVRAGILMLRKKPKVVCTVHGYLFHEEDGLRKWIYLFPEKLCAHITNVLMVMNHEDYEIAQRHRLYRDRLVFIDGMGIDLEKFNPVTPEERASAQKKLGILKEDFVFVYAAEFSERKNQACLIRSFANISREYPHMKLFLAGTGALLEECKALTHELGVSDRICFPGYVKDIRTLYVACDACISVSKIEGLPFNLMEAMACGLPVIASDIKGHSELIENGKSGLLFQNAAEMENQIKRLQNDENLRNSLREAELLRVTKFALPTVFPDVMNQYREIL